MPPVPASGQQKVPKDILVANGCFLALLVIIGALYLTTPFIAALFSFLLLTKLTFRGRRWLALTTFIVILVAGFCGFVVFLKTAFVVLPNIVATSLPKFVQFANAHDIDLPFTDVDSLKSVAMDSVRDTLGYLANFAKIATKEFVFLVAGVAIAIGAYMNPELNRPGEQGPRENLYGYLCSLTTSRFGSFNSSFETVMGAQLIIASINTVLTAIFVFACSIHYALIVVVLTFVCGMLPVIGNIISNTIIVGIALSMSPKLAGWALVFLILIHKGEYFLNSKIMGDRIRHPMWLTLLALIVGERLMGVPGIILAPVVLHFLKVEASRIPISARIDPPGSALERAA